MVERIAAYAATRRHFPGLITFSHEQNSWLVADRFGGWRCVTPAAARHALDIGFTLLDSIY